MKTIFLAAAAVLCISAGVAYAGGGEGEESGGTVPDTFFTQLPGALPQYGPQPNNVAVTNQFVSPPADTAVVTRPANPNNSG
jgi:hypothetical protein